MQVIKFIFIGFVFFINVLAYGQSIDTIPIQEVQIKANKQQFLIGSKIQTIDSVRLSSVSGESLADMLTKQLPIYVRQDAGGLATIRFRGTSPDHTAIMFSGININSLTLGHSNISNIPMFLFDDVKVQFGSSSSLYGTDAIGGSIHLSNNPIWNRGFNIGVQQDISSFGSYFTGLKLGYSGNKLQYSIKLFQQKIENDFPFLNTAVYDFDNEEYRQDTQQNAAILIYGVLQELYLKLSNNLVFYVKLWNEDNWRQIQPNMSTNYYGGDFAEIEDNHLRLLSGFKYYTGSHKITTDFGYIYDYQLYNDNSDEVISTKSFISNTNYFNNNLFKGNFNIGINYKHITPNVHAYQEGIKEDRIDIFASYKKQIISNLSVALNLREAIVIDYKNQFSPSLGINYKLINSYNQKINFKLAISKSYKIPTFNDRFWYPNGDPNLLPEKGISYEFGTIYSLVKTSSSFQFGLTAYIMEVDDWIQWVNLDIWRPKNIKKVNNRGLEFNLQHTLKLSVIKLNSGVNYSLTKAIEADSHDSTSTTTNKQLIYTPEHTGNAFATLNYKKWNISTVVLYTGERFSESYKVLEGYLLWDASLGRNFQLKKSILSVNLKANNILNRAYQNWEWRAMPGRNYSISIKYQL